MTGRDVSRLQGLLLAVAGLVFAAPIHTLAANANTNATLTVDSGACAAFEIDQLPEKYHFDASLNSLVLGTCSASTVTFSKYYVHDACIGDRNNENAISKASDLTCDAATDSSTTTCKKIFTNNADNVVAASTLTVPQSLDSGNVCSNQNNGYVYIYNNCTIPVTATVQLTTGSYKGVLCVSVLGHRLSAWAIVVIAVGGAVILGVAFLLLCCCCCRSLCCCL